MGEKDRGQYLADYHKENLVQVKFNLSRIHDKDIIEFLNTRPNKQGYLKNLIRHDMQAGAMRGSGQVLPGDDYPSGDE